MNQKEIISRFRFIDLASVDFFGGIFFSNWLLYSTLILCHTIEQKISALIAATQKNHTTIIMGQSLKFIQLKANIKAILAYRQNLCVLFGKTPAHLTCTD